MIAINPEAVIKYSIVFKFFLAKNSVPSTNPVKSVMKMKDALTESDFSTIESIAHKIKGSGESYGFKKIGQIGRSL